MLFVSRRRITWLVVIIVNIQLIFCFKYPENFAVQHDSTITDNILEELPILTHVVCRVNVAILFINHELNILCFNAVV